MKADSELIQWLLDQHISRYQISKNTGVTEMTLSRLTNEASKIENLPLKTAAALTEYAERIIKEEKAMNLYITEDGMEFISKEDVYPSDNGEFLHVIAWPKDLHKGDKYKLTFRANPNYNAMEDDPADWSDWVVIAAEFVGDYDAVIKEEDSRLITLNTGDIIAKDNWNGEKWHDNKKEYRPLYSYDFENGDAEIVGIEIR